MTCYRLRFFFDAGAGVYLWSSDASARERYGIAISPEQLPLSAATQQAVNRLVRWYDASLDWDNPAGPTPWSPEECVRFNAAARALLTQLRLQLGTDYDLVDKFKPVA